MRCLRAAVADAPILVVIASLAIISCLPQSPPRPSFPSPLTGDHARFLSSLPPLTFFSYNVSGFAMKRYKPQVHLPMPLSAAHTDAFEKLLYSSLAKSPLRVFSPLDADLFYAPIYISSEPRPSLRRAVLPLLDSQGPWLTRHSGVDHVFVHMVFCINIFAIHLREQMWLPFSLTLPDILWDWVCAEPRMAIKYTVVPYNSNLFPRGTDDDRNISAFFMGDMRPMFWSPHGPAVRQKM
jgi:hypothetical protein